MKTYQKVLILIGVIILIPGAAIGVTTFIMMGFHPTMWPTDGRIIFAALILILELFIVGFLAIDIFSW